MLTKNTKAETSSLGQPKTGNRWLRPRHMTLAAVPIALVAGLLVFGHSSDQPVQLICPPTPQTRLVLLSLSSSERDPHLLEAKTGVISHVMTEAALCHGPVIVTAWSADNTVQTLWSVNDPLKVYGGTDQARRRYVPKIVRAAMTTITGRLRTALAQLPPNRSDFLAWRQIAHDELSELPQSSKPAVAITVLSDGVQVDSSTNLNQPLTTAQAAILASKIPPNVTFLPGTSITLIGIGEVAGPPAPAGGTWLASVRSFAQLTCTATGAHCDVLTNSVYDTPTSP